MDDKIELKQSEASQLLRLAIDKGFDVDKLKIFMDLKDREDNKIAEKEFDRHFAEMQKEYIPAYKKRSVHTKSGQFAYAYCPLSEILAVYAPILSKNNFSYRWAEERVNDTEKRITCFLTGYSHTKESSIDLPYGDTNLLINKIQARGVTTEFGRRYTFVNLTGCIVLSDDSDGKLPDNTLEDGKKTLHLLLPFIPKSLREKISLKISEATKDNVKDLITEVEGIKRLCQSLIKEVENNKILKKKILEDLNNATSIDDITDVEVYVNENL